MNIRLKLFGGLFVLSTNEVSSHITLTNETTGLEEGVFTRNAVDYFDPGNGGSSCLWDFSDLNILSEAHLVSQCIDSLGLITVTDESQITYYIMREDSLLEVGNETPLKETYYYNSPCSMIYPLAFEDAFSKDFEGYGIYCGDHFFKEKGFYYVVADGQGDILLSDTDTLKNVLRVYKLKSYSVAMDLNPSRIDSVEMKQVIEERYEWYVKGYCRPILESVTSTSYADLSPLGTTHYAYCSIPDSLKLNDYQQPDDNNYQEVPQDIIHYNVSIDGGSVDIEYSLDARANITMLISNQMGMIYSNRRFLQDAGTGYNAHFNISGLRSGVYVLYINVNGKVYHETIRK